MELATWILIHHSIWFMTTSIGKFKATRIVVIVTRPSQKRLLTLHLKYITKFQIMRSFTRTSDARLVHNYEHPSPILKDTATCEKLINTNFKENFVNTNTEVEKSYLDCQIKKFHSRFTACLAISGSYDLGHWLDHKINLYCCPLFSISSFFHMQCLNSFMCIARKNVYARYISLKNPQIACHHYSNRCWSCWQKRVNIFWKDISSFINLEDFTIIRTELWSCRWYGTNRWF